MSADVLILGGPPGSGKTTIARLLTHARKRAVHLESDLFFHFITSGYLEPWTPESHSQNVVVMEAVARAAATYARAGYFTVVEGILSPPWFFPPVRDALTAAGCRVGYAILRPPFEVSLSRARAREPETLADSVVIRQLWADFDGLEPSLEPHVFDTTEQTPDETAQLIARQLAAGALDV